MNDTDTTTQMPAPEPPANRPKRLLRSRDRMIAGVAGGLANYFAVDPTIVRLVFALSVFFGGLGVVAYVALALFVPEEGEREGEIEPPLSQRSRSLAVLAGVALTVIALSWGLADFDPWPFDRAWFFGGPLLILAIAAGAYFIVRGTGRLSAWGWLGGILIGLMIFSALAIAAVVSAFAAATGNGVAIASVIIGIGVLLVLAAFNGGARWLIGPAIALALPLGAVAAADISFSGGVGAHTYRPANTASLPDDGRYKLGVGQLRIDLQDFDWSEDEVVELEVDLGVGEVVVAVPEEVCVESDLHVGAGYILMAGDESDGFDARNRANGGTLATPRLELKGEVDLGALRVLNLGDVELDHRIPHFNDDRDEMRAAMDEACAEPEPATQGQASGENGSDGPARGSGPDGEDK